MDTLIGRWIAGDNDAGGEIYRRYVGRVQAFVRRLGKGECDAEEIAQQAMVAGLEGLRGGKRPDHVTRWLMGIARHGAVRRVRERPGNDRETADPAQGGRTVAARREMAELLNRSLDELGPRDRKILDLLHREDLPRRELAERLGESLDNVHARIGRAYAKLRRSLSHHFTTMAMVRAEHRPVSLEAVRRLRPLYREAVIHRDLEGLSDRKAAAKLAVPVATLRARLECAYATLGGRDFSRARKAWQEEMGGRGREGDEGR